MEQLKSIGFLMGIAYRKLSVMLLQKLKDYEITPEQWSVLYHVVQAEGMIQKEIAERTFKDKPTVTRLLDQLERKGYIYRQAGVSDRRSFLIYSTEEGQKLIEQTIDIEASMEDEVINCIGEDSFRQMKQALIQMNQHFTHIEEK